MGSSTDIILIGGLALVVGAWIFYPHQFANLIPAFPTPAQPAEAVGGGEFVEEAPDPQQESSGCRKGASCIISSTGTPGKYTGQRSASSGACLCQPIGTAGVRYGGTIRKSANCFSTQKKDGHYHCWQQSGTIACTKQSSCAAAKAEWQRLYAANVPRAAQPKQCSVADRCNAEGTNFRCRCGCIGDTWLLGAGPSVTRCRECSTACNARRRQKGYAALSATMKSDIGVRFANLAMSI